MLASLSSLVLLVTPPADDPVAARVHVRGVPCPGVEMASRVRAQLGEATALPETLEVDGTLRQREDGQWELELAIARDDGEPTVRTFVAPHCETAIEAGALVIALAIDPTRSASPSTDTEVPPPPADPVPSPDPASAPAPDHSAAP
ncbi:MAG: hypothetical protein IAG13_20215, partial [Deltaproteobacteria bacterium]|nr:hypothetical protein [Nannocystaceae bacterium]